MLKTFLATSVVALAVHFAPANAFMIPKFLGGSASNQTWSVEQSTPEALLPSIDEETVVGSRQGPLTFGQLCEKSGDNTTDWPECENHKPVFALKIKSTNVYIGPNQYARFPVIKSVLDLGVLEEWPTAKLGRDFIDELLERLPGLQDHGCSYREAGGFIRRMTEGDGVWPGHLMEHIALELQEMVGSHVSFGKTRSTDVPGVYNMVYEYKHRKVGLRAGRLARKLILDLLPNHLKRKFDEGVIDPEFDFEEDLDAFTEYARRNGNGPSTQSLVDAAKDRNIPYFTSYNFMQFGYGKYQRRIQATITSETSHLAVELASDKAYTNELLKDMGLPVPAQELVYSKTEALKAASEYIGYPVVVKPLNAHQGKGVSVNLNSDDEVVEAFYTARKHTDGRSVVVEKFAAGFDHRMLVVNGKLVAAAKRIPGHIVGDGTHTIEELVEIVNMDPRRGVGHEKELTKIEFDPQAERLVLQQGYTRQTVLSQREVLYLRSTANLSTGGTAVDVTDTVHPDNRDMAKRAMLAIGLDVGGVDFVTKDISKSYKDIGGVIIEINAAPGFRMHLSPTEGKPRDVAGPVVDMLFPPGTRARIPIAAITGTNGKTTTTRMVSHILKTSGRTVGMTTTDGVYSNGHLTYKGDMSGPSGAQMVLRDPLIDTAVVEVARGGIMRRGLGFTECEVSACLNIASDHLGFDGLESLSDLARVKRVVLEVATDTVVINADDHHCMQMVSFTIAHHICYFTMDPSNTLVRDHILKGGRAVVLERGINGETITIYDKGVQIPLMWTHQIPATLDGKAIHNVKNAMAAAGVAYSMGGSLDDIRDGLGQFDTTFFQTPGRMNFFREHPFTVMLDYAHNAHGMEALTNVVDSIDVVGLRHIVLANPGDRRDEDIQAFARVAAGHYDRFICHSDDDRRGRGDYEVPLMMHATLLEAGVPEEAVMVFANETDAVNVALEGALPGDLVVVIGGDDLARCWDQIIHFKPANTNALSLDDGRLRLVKQGAIQQVMDSINDTQNTKSWECDAGCKGEEAD